MKSFDGYLKRKFGDNYMLLAGGGSKLLSDLAHRLSDNDLIAHGNEFNFASSKYNGGIFINYRTASGNRDGNITSYLFCDGKGGTLATISSGLFSGNSSSSTTSSYPAGFTSRASTDWSGITGTLVTDWSVNGADIMFKLDGSKLNVITDGRFYQGIDIYGSSKRVLDEYDISYTKWGDSDTVDNQHIESTYNYRYTSDTFTNSGSSDWYLLIQTETYINFDSLITISASGDNRCSQCTIHVLCRSNKYWGWLTYYNAVAVKGIYKRTDYEEKIYIKIPGTITSVVVRSSNTVTVTKGDYSSNDYDDTNSEGFFSNFFMGQFYKFGSSNDYVLLGGGGHKSVSDFATSTHNHNADYVTSLSTNNSYLTWTKNGSTSNITVPYATYTTKVTTSWSLNVNSCYENLFMRLYYNLNMNNGYAGSDNSYGFPCKNNANGLLWIPTHNNNYGGQIGVSSDGYLYYRFIIDGSFPTSSNGASWNRIAYYSEIPTKSSWDYDDKYITFVGVTNDTQNHPNQLRYILNGNNTYFTVPYATNTLTWNGLTTIRQLFPDASSTNNHIIPPIIAGFMSAGYPIYDDPCFKLSEGNNSITVYNNYNNGNVTITRIDDNLGSGNSSGKILKIVTNGSATPGAGGFYLTILSRANAIFILIFRAKVPIGYNVNTASNNMGDSYSDRWLTDLSGTGKWEWYARIVHCGASGSMSNGGHIYLTGTSNTSVTWYVSYCNLIDLTKGEYNGLRSRYSDYSDSIAWSGITSKPETATRWPSWNEVTDKPSTFSPSSHTHNYIVSLGNKSANDLSSTYPKGLSTHGIYYNNNYPFYYGCGITAYSNGGAFQIAGQWNSSVTGSSDYDYPTEMYIRGRRDAYDVWTTWTRVLTDRNYTSFTVKKDGTGASGTWGINITGSAGSVVWNNITSKPSLTGNSTQPVYWDGSTFVTCTSYSNASVNYANSAGNSDTIDGYHISDQYNLPYKSVTTVTCSTSSMTTDYWYVKLLLDSSYLGIINGKMFLSAAYSNRMTRAELQVFGYYLNYSYKASKYNSDLICGIASVREVASLVIWLKLKKPVAYEGNTPDGKLTICHNNIKTATYLVTAPSDVTFIDTLDSDGLHIISSDVMGKFHHYDHNNNDSVLLAGGSYATLSSLSSTHNHDDIYLYSRQESLVLSNVTWAIGYSNTHRRAFIYNTYGTEFSYLFGLSSSNATINGSATYSNYGAILKMGYADKYLRILRVNAGKWYKTNGESAALGSTDGVDWEKISAGYADSAGSVAWSGVTNPPATATRWPAWSEVTNKPDTFTPSSHTHNYLPLSGGTMTGNITMGSNSIVFNTSTTSNWNVAANTGLMLLNTVGASATGAPGSYYIGLSVSGYYGFQLATYG